MEREAHGKALRLTRLQQLGLSEGCQRFGRLAQLSLRRFVIHLHDFFTSIYGSRIRYSDADFDLRLTRLVYQLRFPGSSLKVVYEIP